MVKYHESIAAFTHALDVPLFGRIVGTPAEDRTEATENTMRLLSYLSTLSRVQWQSLMDRVASDGDP